MIQAFFISFFLFLSTAKGFTADLAQHIVRIETDFLGEELVVFGGTDEPGDIILVVRGPEESLIIRKKDKVNGLWLNHDALLIHEVPRFYAIACTNPIKDILSVEELKRHQIGLHEIHLSWPQEKGDITPFKEALVAQKIKQGHFLEKCQKVDFISNDFFRVTFNLPATIPTGAYTVQVFFINDHIIKEGRTIPFIVTKSGSSAEFSEYAFNNAFLYGLFSSLTALILGFIISLFFRNRP